MNAGHAPRNHTTTRLDNQAAKFVDVVLPMLTRVLLVNASVHSEFGVELPTIASVNLAMWNL